jgi:hypothetical protein
MKKARLHKDVCGTRRKSSRTAAGSAAIAKPRRRFTAEADGTVPRGQTLVPSGVYVLQEAQPSSRSFPSRESLVAWIKNCVLGDLRTLKVGISVYLSDPARFGSARLGGANFLLASGCATALEYFARIYNGDLNAVENVRKYAGDFLRDVNPRYLQVAEVLQRILRNGLVHGSWPKTFALKSAQHSRVTVGIGVEPNDVHLAPIPGWKGLSLGINASRFLQDLETSVETGFEPWLLQRSPEAALARAAPGLLVVSPGDRLEKEIAVVARWNDSG